MVHFKPKSLIPCCNKADTACWDRQIKAPEWKLCKQSCFLFVIVFVFVCIWYPLLKVGAVKTGVCNYLYGRDVKATGKFCAGGVVDACQVIALSSSFRLSGILMLCYSCWCFSLYTAVLVLTIFLLQEDSGGPLMCHNKGRYELVGIVSSGKGWEMRMRQN